MANQACGAAFEIFTKSVMVTTCFANPAGSDAKIQAAKSLLIGKGILPSGEFDGVQIKFCKIGAEGITPDRTVIYANNSYLQKSDVELAVLLAHEMTHVRQYRRLGTDNFKCQYSRKYVECRGCQDDSHDLEKEAYEFEDAARLRLMR